MAQKEKWQLNESDARAEFYDKHFVPAIFADWALLLVDAADVAPGCRVLDAACGTGIVARVVADQLGGRVEITGIDLNESMIKVARRICPDVDWRQGNVSDMPFADERFDIVLCQAALPFFPDQVMALQEMRRVLCSGGRIAVQIPGAMPRAFEIACEILERVASKEIANAWRASFTLRDPSDVLPLFRKAGFQSINLQAFQAMARYPSMEAFLHAHIDFFTAGRVDVDAMLPLACDKLEPFYAASGAMHIPIESYIVTALKN
jgi:ubiquinone/menaquinone biosynthesis C-methylase UbiE